MDDTITMRDTQTARKAMIDSQLRTSGVNEEYVLARMMAVPRETALSADKASLAYIDRAIATDDGGHLASPLFYGKLLTQATPHPSDTALVVEGGTSYLTDLLRPLVAKVTVISAEQAAQGAVPTGDYSLICVDGAIEALPQPLEAALADGGRIATGVVLRGVTRLALGRKIGGQLALEPVEDLGIPVLHHFDQEKGWSFS